MSVYFVIIYNVSSAKKQLRIRTLVIYIVKRHRCFLTTKRQKYNKYRKLANKM